MIMPKNRPPTHPGEMLVEEFLNPLNLTQGKLAESIGVGVQTINMLVNRKRGVTPDMALRLSRFFGTSPEVWINLQTSWDLWHEMHSPKAEEIKRIKPMTLTTK